MKLSSRPLEPLRLLPLAAVLAGIGLAPAGAQDETRSETPRWPPHYHDTAEVRVVNVDVVVTDRQGHPAADLERADFELLVDGRPVEISNFYAVSDGQVVAFEPTEGGGAVAGPSGQRLNVLLFVDNAHLREAHRHRAFTALDTLVDHEWRGDVRMMLATYDHPGARSRQALEVRQPFTRDRGEMLAAIDALSGLAVSGGRFDAQRRELVRTFERVDVPAANTFTFDEDGKELLDSFLARKSVNTEVSTLAPLIQVYAQERYEDAQATLATLRHLVDIAAGLPGRSVLIHVSDGVPLRGGEMFFEAYQQRFASVHSTNETVPGMDAQRYDSSNELEEVVARASAAGVAFYPLDVSTPSSFRLGAEANSGERFFDSSMSTIDDENRREPLRALAHGTGGQAGLSPSALVATLDGIFNDFENHYSLGFTLDPDDHTTERRIEVKVRRPGLRARSRRLLRDENPAERVAQQVLATLLTEQTENRLDIDLAADPATAATDGTWVVPVHVRVPIAELVLLPGKSEHQARVTLWVAVRDERGRLSRVVQHVCPIAVANSEVLVALGRRMDCGVRLQMRGGRQDIAVAVRDEVSRVVSTSRLSLDVPGAAAEEQAAVAAGAGSSQ